MAKDKSGKLGLDLSAAAERKIAEPVSKRLGSRTNRPHSPDGWQQGGRDGRDS